MTAPETRRGHREVPWLRADQGDRPDLRRHGWSRSSARTCSTSSITAPRELEKVEGIGPTRRKKIKDAWNEQRTVREIMTFLFSHGVTHHPRLSHLQDLRRARGGHGAARSLLPGPRHPRHRVPDRGPHRGAAWGWTGTRTCAPARGWSTCSRNSPRKGTVPIPGARWWKRAEQMLGIVGGGGDAGGRVRPARPGGWSSSPGPTGRTWSTLPPCSRRRRSWRRTSRDWRPAPTPARRSTGPRPSPGRRGRSGLDLRPRPGGGDPPGGDGEGDDHHRRARGGQDHPGQRHPADPRAPRS